MMAWRSGTDPSLSPSQRRFGLAPAVTWMTPLLLLVMCPLSLALPKELESRGQFYLSPCTSSEDGIMIRDDWVYNCSKSITFSLLGCATKEENYDSDTHNMERHVKLWHRGIYNGDPKKRHCKWPKIEMIDCQWSAPIIRCVSPNARECVSPTGIIVPYRTGLEENDMRYFCESKYFSVYRHGYDHTIDMRSFLYQCDLDVKEGDVRYRQFCSSRTPKALIKSEDQFARLYDHSCVYRKGEYEQAVIPRSSGAIVAHNYNCIDDPDFVKEAEGEPYRSRVGKIEFQHCISYPRNTPIPLGGELIENGERHVCKMGDYGVPEYFRNEHKVYEDDEEEED